MRLRALMRCPAWVRRGLSAAVWRRVLILLPVVAIAVGLAAYGVWWRVLADGVRDSIIGLQTEQKGLRRNLDWNALRVGGFPYVVDATLSKTRFLAPDIGTVWDGERVRVQLRPFSPGSIRLSLEGEQHLLYIADGRWIEADMRADRAVLSGRSKDLAQSVTADLDRLTGKGRLDVSDFSFILERGRTGLVLSAAETPDGLPRLDVSLQIANLAVQGPVALPLGSSLEQFDLDVGLHLPQQMPVATAEAILKAWRDTGTPLVIRAFVLDWGGVFVSVNGELRLDGNNMPTGPLTLTVGNHSRLLEMAQGMGWVTGETAQRAKRILDMLAFVSGDPKRKVTVPLRFSGGDVYLGPVRLLQLTAGSEIPEGEQP